MEEEQVDFFAGKLEQAELRQKAGSLELQLWMLGFSKSVGRRGEWGMALLFLARPKN